MLQSLLWRLSSAALALLLVSTLTFFSLAQAPGDAATQALGERATPETLAHWRHGYGLDQPLTTRYWCWLAAISHGEWGRSWVSQRPVVEVVWPAAQRSLRLAVAASLVMLLVGVGGGILAACYQGRWLDRIVSSLALVGLSTPEFMLATLMILLFSVTLEWLPAVSLPPLGSGMVEQWHILLLPALTLGLTAACYVLRMVRATLLRQVNAPWVIGARLNGVAPLWVLWRHILPGAAASLLQILAATLPYLLGGAIVVERLYGYPGLGELLLNALAARDSILLQAGVVVLALNAILCWQAADLCAAGLARWGGR